MNFDLNYLPKNFKLKREQLDALDFCYARKEAIMSLGTGVGKTITSCILVKRLLNEINNSIAVFIVPAKAIKAFKKEMALCDMSYHLWESEKQQNNPGAKVIIITHTALNKYLKELERILRIRTCICVVDEIHNFSVNYETAKPTPNKGTKALISIRPYFKYFYALTATTIRNNVMSLYTMCNIVSPNYFGSPATFQKEFCNIQYKWIKAKRNYSRRIPKITGLKPSRKLEYMKNNLIIFRQLKYDVKFNEIDIPLDVDMWRRYRWIGAGNFIDRSKKNSKLTESSLRLIELQRLMDNCTEYFVNYKLSNKEKVLIDLIKSLIKENHIPIIYCFYLETIDRVKQVLEESNLGLDEIFIISGQIPKKERALIEDKIAKNTVTIINKAGTESINLQKADTMIYYNMPWSIDEYLQSVGRITRNDTKFNEQLVYFLQYEGTIDNYKMFNIKNRLSLVEKFQGEQVASSDGVTLTENERSEMRKLLLWCSEQTIPLSKDELIEAIKNHKYK